MQITKQAAHNEQRNKFAPPQEGIYRSNCALEIIVTHYFVFSFSYIARKVQRKTVFNLWFNG